MTRSPLWLKCNRAIRAACKEHDINDEARRAVIEQVCGKTSLGDCSALEVEKVLVAINRLYGKPTARRRAGQKSAKPNGRRSHNISDHPAQAGLQKKVLALWLVLYDLAIVADNHDAALNAFVRRHTGIDALRWLEPEDCDHVIRILKAMIKDRLEQKGIEIGWAHFKGHHPACAVTQAQFDLLVKAGERPRSITPCEDEDFQAVQRDWGHWLRDLNAKGRLW